MVLFFSCIVYVLQKRLLLLLVRYKQMLLSLNKMAILFTYVFCLSLSQRHLYFVNLIVLFLFVFIVFFSFNLVAVTFFWCGFFFHHHLNSSFRSLQLFHGLFKFHAMSSNLPIWVRFLFVKVG